MAGRVSFTAHMMKPVTETTMKGAKAGAKTAQYDHDTTCQSLSIIVPGSCGSFAFRAQLLHNTGV